MYGSHFSPLRPATNFLTNGIGWGSIAGGADLTLGERVDRTGAYVMLAFHGGLADQYMKHLTQTVAQSAR